MHHIEMELFGFMQVQNMDKKRCHFGIQVYLIRDKQIIIIKMYVLYVAVTYILKTEWNEYWNE